MYIQVDEKKPVESSAEDADDSAASSSSEGTSSSTQSPGTNQPSVTSKPANAGSQRRKRDEPSVNKPVGEGNTPAPPPATKSPSDNKGETQSPAVTEKPPIKVSWLL